MLGTTFEPSSYCCTQALRNPRQAHCERNRNIPLADARDIVPNGITRPVHPRRRFRLSYASYITTNLPPGLADTKIQPALSRGYWDAVENGIDHVRGWPDRVGCRFPQGLPQGVPCSECPR